MMKVCTQCKHPGCVSMMLLSLRCQGNPGDDSPLPNNAQSDSEWELSCWASQRNPLWKQQHISYIIQDHAYLQPCFELPSALIN